MATSKVRAKAKLKKSIGRITKMKLGNTVSCEVDNSDLSQLRKPIEINMTSLRQIAQLFEKGSDEVRDILTYECDIIYECKICRSLFRSLANLISHKRVYCTQKFFVKPRKYSADPTDSIYCKSYNSDKRTSVDFDYKENCSNDRILRSQATRKEPKKDLTSVIDMLMRKQNNDECENNCNERPNNCPLRISSDNEQVLLEMMDSNQAAYQTILPPQISVSNNDDLMKTQTEELKDLSNRTAVLGPDGQCQEICSNISGNAFQDENDDFDLEMKIANAISEDDLTCTMCNTKFATKKTLTFHVKCQHTPLRLGFPCPCCSSTFTNRWSVYRHLFKVHRKTNDQVRRLRSQIKAKAFRRDLSKPEKSSKSGEAAQENITKETQNTVIAQEWIENLELDTELQRCGACGKRFERKAALVSHSQICKKLVANRNKFSGRFKRASKNPPQRIIESPENVISDETSTTSTTIKVESSSLTMDMESSKISDSQRPLATSEPPKENMETAIRVKDVSSLSKDVWDRMGNDNFANNSEPVTNKSVRLPTIPVNQSELLDNFKSQESSEIVENSLDCKTSIITDSLDIPEVIYTRIDNSRPVALSVLDKEKKLGIQYRGIRLPTVTLEKINIPSCRGDCASDEPAISFNSSATGSMSIEDEKMLASHANIRKLQCLPCNRKFTTLLNLRRHIAVHRRRSRFCCKICDFKAFLKCDFVAHCNKKHNAKNNRKTLSQLIIEMPINSESIDEQTKEVADDEKIDKWKSDNFEVIDVPNVVAVSENPPKIINDLDRQDEQEENKNSSENQQIPADPPVKEKPRRGRPRKSKGTRKNKVGKKKYVRKPRHVSPPKLNDDLSESDEIITITNAIKSAEQLSKKSGEFSRLRAPSRMDSDPELRKMVMEVIFGPAEKPVDDIHPNNSNGSAEEEITIEQIDTNILDHREECQNSYSQSGKALRNGGQIEGDKREDMEIQCNQVKLSNNNLQRDSKNVTFRDDITIMEDVVLEKISTNGRIVGLQNRNVSHGHPEAITSAAHETVRLILYEHGNDKKKDIRQTDIFVSAQR